jgi:hypothetical protein
MTADTDVSDLAERTLHAADGKPLGSLYVHGRSSPRCSTKSSIETAGTSMPERVNTLRAAKSSSSLIIAEPDFSVIATLMSSTLGQLLTAAARLKRPKVCGCAVTVWVATDHPDAASCPDCRSQGQAGS